MKLRQLGKQFSGWRLAAAVVSAFLVVGVLLWWRLGEHAYVRLLLESPSSGKCRRELNRAVLQRSLELGAEFFLAHQKPQGNFDYQYDWREQSLSSDDNEVRQAGALWGVALLQQTLHTPELARATERGLDFFEQHSHAIGKLRCVAYPGSARGAMGTIALVALSYIEYLRDSASSSARLRELYEQRLDQYIEMLLASRLPSGLWHAEYDPQTCSPSGEASPYFDGEALLALTKAAKYMGRTRLVGAVMEAAAAGKRLNIERALNEDADSDTTKGYYQWSSMAFHELAGSNFPNASAYGAVLMDLADWMIDTHKVLLRTRNTGYAFEGLISAYALAAQRGDARAAKYACVIDIGMQRLVSWQVAGPVPNRFTQDGKGDARARGGVQNAAFESPLRIDVTQHQMHATALALEHVYREGALSPMRRSLR